MQGKVVKINHSNKIMYSKGKKKEKKKERNEYENDLKKLAQKYEDFFCL